MTVEETKDFLKDKNSDKQMTFRVKLLNGTYVEGTVVAIVEELERSVILHGMELPK